MDAENWAEKKSLERLGQNFLKTVLELSGYKVMDYGIENHNQEIIALLKCSYKYPNNRQLLSMPDLVVIEPNTKESFIVEVKYRKFPKYFEVSSTNFALRYAMIKQYMEHWSNAVLVFVMNVKPFCICVDVSSIDWSQHFKGHAKLNGRHAEIWNFNYKYKTLNDRFPLVTADNFRKALDILL